MGGISQQILIALPLLVIVAALYSSVGHGGASGYWAVFTFVALPLQNLVAVVLVLNIIVASISFFHFRKPGDFQFKRLLPFIITSIPAAFIGGMWRVSAALFPLFLGLALLVSGLRLFGLNLNPHRKHYEGIALWRLALPIGLLLGLVSGMIGIGGGIFLSPILLFLGITDTKGSAAMSSAFIVLNSISGLFGQAPHTSVNAAAFAFIVLAGVLGALIGSNWGAFRSKVKRLQAVLATVLVFASLKLLESGIQSLIS